jgi:hypothetical protein
MNTYLKVALSAVALAALVVVPAAAKSRTQQHTTPASADIYQSYSQGHQSYPNPDRGPYPTPVPTWAEE